MSSIRPFELLCAALAAGAFAQQVTSLYLPLFDGNDGLSATADALGVDEAGHKSWAIRASGEPTFTLVEGSDQALLTGAVTTKHKESPIPVSASCDLAEGVAVCVLSAGTESPVTITESIKLATVELGSTLPTTSVPTASTTITTLESGSTAEAMVNMASYVDEEEHIFERGEL